MPKRCILYPNDINYLSYSPKYFYSGTDDTSLIRDTHNTKHLFALAVFAKSERLAVHRDSFGILMSGERDGAFEE